MQIGSRYTTAPPHHPVWNWKRISFSWFQIRNKIVDGRNLIWNFYVCVYQPRAGSERPPFAERCGGKVREQLIAVRSVRRYGGITTCGGWAVGGRRDAFDTVSLAGNNAWKIYKLWETSRGMAPHFANSRNYLQPYTWRQSNAIVKFNQLPTSLTQFLNNITIHPL